MPDGLMQWYDEGAGEGRIVHNGRRYVARDEATEPKARVPGARVHFDIDSHADGAVAANVAFRPGTRVSRRQRRFGDLTGSSTVDSKGAAPFTQAHPEMGRDLQRHPMRVVELWADLVASGDVDGAMLLYSPAAVMHAGGDVLVGRNPIRGHIETVVERDVPGPLTVRGDDDLVMVRWGASDLDGDAFETHLRILHGEIVEQWLGTVRVTVDDAGGPSPIEFSAAGSVSDHDRDAAIAKMEAVLDTTETPILHASVRLERAADPARERPVQARASVDLDGEPVRAHVRAGTPSEAMDLLDARLRRQLRHVVEKRRDLHREARVLPDGEWRHGGPSNEREAWHPRPPDERSIVRHKTYGPKWATVDEAVFDLEAMDYDFFLFSDLGTGQDSVVERREDDVYVVQHMEGSTPHSDEPTSAAVETVALPAAVLSQSEARERLDAGHEPRVFFKDASSGRGHVLYRRHDGHYGLITPSDEPSAGPT